MTQFNRGIIICLLLLSTAVGCGERTTPEATTSPQGEASPSAAASPQDNKSLQTEATPSATTTKTDFKKIAGNGVDLSLPATYEGGNPSKDLDAIASKLKKIRPEYDKKLEALKKNPSAISLLAFDTKVSKSGFVTNVNALPEKVPAGTTIDQYLQAATKQLAGQFKIVDQKVVPLDQYQAGRIVAELSRRNVKIKQLFYIIPKGNNFWLVTYSTTDEEFEQRLPTFEQSVRSLIIKS